MTSRGILIFNHEAQEWLIWICQQPYFVFEGSLLELRVQNTYFEAMIIKDFNWCVALKYDVKFTLHPHEVYKVRIRKDDFFRADAPY